MVSKSEVAGWLVALAALMAACTTSEGEPTAVVTPPPSQTAAPTVTPTVEPSPTHEHLPDLPWWNDRVFYEVFVRSFSDSDGDGVGDINGLIERLDYLNDGDPAGGDDLGVTGLWLMPVAEAASYHGYDVVDYRQIEQDYGSNDDFQRLIEEAHARGIAVIVDLVLNHTSSEHPWFIEAQQPGSERESWYIWQDENPGYLGPFGGQAWHELDGRYYYGIFWSGMPDLNYENPAVSEEMLDVTRFWLEDMGVDGFRLDAVRHLIEEGEVQANTGATHAWLEGFHDTVKEVKPESLVVGEVWDTSLAVVPYTGDELDIAFEFDLASAMVQSVARGKADLLVYTMGRVLELYPAGQYAAFLTNHDQDRVMKELDENPEAAKAAATLLLTGPGVPFIYYGEEVGQTGGKPDEYIRTPMLWDGTELAGFTTGEPWINIPLSFRERNVAAQLADPGSLLNHYRALIALRGEQPALRAGATRLVESSDPRAYAVLRSDADGAVLVLVNVSGEVVADYALALGGGPLTAGVGASLLLGEGDAAAPEVSGGGFSGYAPLAELAPYSSTIIRLAP